MIGDLLVGLDEHTISGRPLAHGHEYLISDFPLTREVVDSGEPRWVSRLDPKADANEAALLSKLGFESLLMVCLPTSNSCWGLVELYAEPGQLRRGARRARGPLREPDRRAAGAARAAGTRLSPASLAP